LRQPTPFYVARRYIGAFPRTGLLHDSWPLRKGPSFPYRAGTPAVLGGSGINPEWGESEGANWYGTSLPWWAIVILLLALPAARAVALASRAAQRRAAIRAGQCPKCGYDLRATPHRCPECGATPRVV
jgi:hypothetical protein